MTAAALQRPIRVLLVDDDAMARSGIAAILSTVPDVEVVAQVDDGDQVVTAILAHRPDVVILDVRMARQDGITTVAQVKAMPTPPKVLMLTTFNTDDAAVRSIVAGADGFLLKTATREAMVDGIRQAAAGTGAAVSAEAASLLIEQLREGSGTSALQRQARDLVARLTEREREVLIHSALGHTHRATADALYISESTVKTHQKGIRAKFGEYRDMMAVIAERAGLLS